MTDEIAVKGRISTGYKSPTLKQAADDFSGITGRGIGILKENPNLEPKKSINYEIRTSYDDKDTGINAGLTAFYSDFKDKIVEFRDCQCPTCTLNCS